MIHLGIVADEVHPDPRRAAAICRSLGLGRLEIRFLPSGRVPLCDAADLRTVEEVLGETECTVTAISPGLFQFTDTGAGFRREMAEVYPRAAELAHRWKLAGMIVFGFHKPGASEANATRLPRGEAPDQVVDWMAVAAERAARDGLLLLVEPAPMCVADTAKSAADLIRRVGSPQLRIDYAPGNDAWLLNRDPFDGFAAAAPYIASVHIADLRPLKRGAAFPEWVPAGEGLVDYTRHFTALREIGFAGPISLEPHMDGRPETIRRCIAAVEKLAAPLEARSETCPST